MSAGSGERGTPPAGGGPQPARFAALAERTVGALLELDPVAATALGDHRYDDRLPDQSAAGVEQAIEVLADAMLAIDQIDDEALPVGDRVDLEILRNRVSGHAFGLQTVREHTWNPLEANPGTALHLLLARDFAPLPDRLQSLAGRLAAVPRALEDARDLLQDMPRVHVETAIGQFEGTHRLITTGLQEALAADAGSAALVAPVRDAAAEAVAEHVRWLRSQLDGAHRDPRLGAQTYAAKLWHTLDAETTPDQVLASAEADLARFEGEIARVAAAYLGEPTPPPDDAAALVRRALAAVADDAVVTDATVLPLCAAALERTAGFVRDHDLVTVHDDAVEIIEMPQIHRGVSVAYCDPPGPLETAPLPTFFAVSPAPSDWPADRVTSFYREYNAQMLHNLTVHEAMPGHVLQLAHSRRCADAGPVRQAFWSGPFVEGWAVYAEALLVSRGYSSDGTDTGRLAVALQQLKMALRMTINAILDVRVHTRGMTEDEAMRLMTVRGHQEEGEAVGKWRRALLTSTQLATYYVGWSAVQGLAGDLQLLAPEQSERARHDAMLAHGSPPPRHLRTLLGL
ncbi:MAG TPA: DUF885 domain-containing protein [Candidatus Nanopelagicales bacterium]|nr:DUF885 domain-containing protein [Candidatus Nanopelagicales bacterium]